MFAIVNTALLSDELLAELRVMVDRLLVFDDVYVGFHALRGN